MAKIVNLPPNVISKEDKERLEAFGGHTIAHGRATRWHWAQDATGDDIFEFYIGGDDEVLAARISRDREHDAFLATDSQGQTITSGTLDHVFAELEDFFTRLHGEK